MLQKPNRRWWWWMVVMLTFIKPVQAQVKVLPLDQKNIISADWYVQDRTANQLVPYIASEHSSYNAVHQWVSISPVQPFLVEFTAKKDLCIYLNNKLIFKADATSAYILDLATHSKGIQAVEGKYLLTAWHPVQQPLISTFKNHLGSNNAALSNSQSSYFVKLKDYINLNAFVLFVLLIGLMYGGLKTSFTSDFQNIYSPDSFFRSNLLGEGILAKPIRSWSSILFVLTFSLSMALLIAAIHTNVQQLELLSRFFPVSDADITTKIIFYTFLIFVSILLKYLFLKVMGFIFELDEVVQVQYNEFIRTILFLGIFLPFVMLLYLTLNNAMPKTVLLVSNLAVSLLLIITTIRVFITVNKKATVLNLHLFSYLCATEVIPLAIGLKLIVFNF